MKRLVPLLLSSSLAVLAWAPAIRAFRPPGASAPAQPVIAEPAPTTHAPTKPAPSPTPSPELHGTVLGPDGKPIERALVAAVAVASRSSDWKPRSTRTGADGAFRLPLPLAAHYTVRVEADGLAGHTLEKVKAGRPLQVRLHKGGVIRGSVRDGSTGQPLPGVRVEAALLASPVKALPDDPMFGRVGTTTDAQGRYTLSGIGAGQHTVSARARGFSRAERASVLAGAGVDFHLFPGGTITGLVRDTAGQPLAGALVQAESDESWQRWRSQPEATDARGAFEIVGVPPGTYSVVARHRDHAPSVQAGLVLEGGGDGLQVDMKLEAGAAVAGRLVDRQGRPRAGRVSVEELDGAPLPGSLQAELSVHVGEDGAFRLERVPPGAHTLHAAGRGRPPQPLNVTVHPGVLDLGDVRLEGGLAIRGRVLDAQGRPLADASVTGRLLSAEDPEWAETTSAADGSFALDGLRPGEYALSARLTGYADGADVVEAGTENAVLRLSPGGGLTGVVLDPTGRPVSGFGVSLQSPAGARGGGPVSSEDGRFTFTELEPGRYVVSISAPRAAPAALAAEVAAGSLRDLGPITLEVGGTVRGTVADAAGNPLAGATVTVRGPERTVPWAARAEAVSDGAGAFTVEGAPAGTVTVTAAHPLYAPGRANGVEVDPARGPAEVRLVLSRGARIEGSARTRDGLPVSDARVEVWAASPRVDFGPPSGAPVRGDGTFTIDRVRPGRAQVRLMDRNGDSYARSQSREVDLREGETARVDFVRRDILVTGRVSHGGAPLAGASVRLRCGEQARISFGPRGAAVPEGGPHRHRATTRADGSYEMLVDEPGTCAADVDAPGERQAVGGLPVQIADAESVTVDLELAGTALTGVVVDEADQPAAGVEVTAFRNEGPRGTATTRTGPDGRFSLDAQPGDYVVRAWPRPPDDGRAEAEVTVTESGAPEVRLVLGRGLTLAGRVVDGAGRAVGGALVRAWPQRGETGRALSFTLADGTFRLRGLADGPYNVAGRSHAAAFALRSGLSPGAGDIVLTLRPSGWIRVHVKGPDGRPVEGALAEIETVDGQRYGTLVGMRTGAEGTVELPVPPGLVALRITKDRLVGRATLTVREGDRSDLSTPLEPPDEKE